jgi:hypothetical protein
MGRGRLGQETRIGIVGTQSVQPCDVAERHRRERHRRRRIARLAPQATVAPLPAGG